MSELETLLKEVNKDIKLVHKFESLGIFTIELEEVNIEVTVPISDRRDYYHLKFSLSLTIDYVLRKPSLISQNKISKYSNHLYLDPDAKPHSFTKREGNFCCYFYTVKFSENEVNIIHYTLTNILHILVFGQAMYLVDVKDQREIMQFKTHIHFNVIEDFSMFKELEDSGEL